MMSPDINVITESWTHAELNDAKVSVAGYRLLKKGHDDDRIGGGVAMMVK